MKRIAIIAAVAVTVALFVSMSLFAATNIFSSNEIEAGTRSGNSSAVTDGTASGGTAVKFGVVAGGCSVSTPFTPGGPDPWGGCWPGPDNTGVPTGTTLTNYTGSCTITTNNTTINARNINCEPLKIQASNVTITNSLITGGIDIPTAYCGSASLTLIDSGVDIPAIVGSGGNYGSNGILRCNFSTNRVEVTGGRRSIYCVSNCTIENTWVHEQGVDPNAVAHFSGIRMEQYTTIRHNSITCEATRSGPGSGCSAGLTGYPDFAPINNNLVERNIFFRGANGGSTVCAYGGATDGKPFSDDPTNATYNRFISNRFVRAGNQYCGNVETILHFDGARTGNVWTDNLYDDGAAVNP